MDERINFRPWRYKVFFRKERIMAILKVEKSMWRNFFLSFRRRSKTTTSYNNSYGLSNGHKYNMLLYVMIFSSLFEFPFAFLMISLLISDKNKQLVWHFFLLFLTAYSLIWLRSDRFSVRRTPHVIGDDHLDLNCGFRVCYSIKIACIIYIKRIDYLSWNRDYAVLKKAGKDLLLVTPFDEPNVLIEVDRSGLEGERLGMKIEALQGSSSVAIYVDHPNEFIRDLREALETKELR
jgi:hypothetical protein